LGSVVFVGDQVIEFIRPENTSTFNFESFKEGTKEIVRSYQRGNQKVPKGSPEGTKEISRRNNRGDQKVSIGRQKVPIGKPEVIRR
jgi:hypothetical protein